MSKQSEENPTHTCPVFGRDAIIPRVAKMVNGELIDYGYKCPMCGIESVYISDNKTEE